MTRFQILTLGQGSPPYHSTASAPSPSPQKVVPKCYLRAKSANAWRTQDPTWKVDDWAGCQDGVSLSCRKEAFGGSEAWGGPAIPGHQTQLLLDLIPQPPSLAPTAGLCVPWSSPGSGLTPRLLVHCAR